MPDATEDDALRIAERALNELQRPFTVGERAGVGRAPASGCASVCAGRAPTLLLRDADTAMYAAKATGRGNVQVFRPEMHHAARERLQIASELGVGDLRRATQPALPADRGAGHRAHHRRRGAGPLAASRPRAAAAGGLHRRWRRTAGTSSNSATGCVQAAITQLRGWIATAAGPRSSCMSISPRSRSAGRGWPISSRDARTARVEPAAAGPGDLRDRPDDRRCRRPGGAADAQEAGHRHRDRRLRHRATPRSATCAGCPSTPSKWISR